MNTDLFNAETQRREGAELSRRAVGENRDWNRASVAAFSTVFLPKCQFLLRGHVFLLKTAQFVCIRHRSLSGLFNLIADRPEVEHRLIGPATIAAWLHCIAGGFVTALHLPPFEVKPSNENKPCCNQSQCDTGDNKAPVTLARHGSRGRVWRVQEGPPDGSGKLEKAMAGTNARKLFCRPLVGLEKPDCAGYRGQPLKSAAVAHVAGNGWHGAYGDHVEQQADDQPPRCQLYAAGDAGLFEPCFHERRLP